MTGKQLKLIQALPADGSPITAGALSLSLSVSPRSVKNYIAEIGVKYPGLIMSTPKGYCLSVKRYEEWEKQEATLVPETSEERAEYIINQLLSGKPKAIDLDTFTEMLFVSGETLRKDLSIVRRRLKEFDLYLEPYNNAIRLGGAEINKRRMLSEILFQSFNKNVLSISAIQTFFPGYDVAGLKKLVVEICDKRHYFINGYALNNLMLDLMISVDRMNYNKLTSFQDSLSRKTNAHERALAQEIVAGIERMYDVVFNEYELDELTVLLSGYLIRLDRKNIALGDVRKIVGDQLMDLIEEMKNELNCFKILDSENSDLMTQFILHVHNLIMRLEGNYVTRNPLTEHIKTTCPLIFEYAVEISDAIYEKTGLHAGEHEAAYIALHIGNMLETQQSLRNKVTCVILHPDYYNMGSKMAAQLADTFDVELVLKGIATSEDEILQYEGVDLLVSTVPVDSPPNSGAVLLSPFLTERDISIMRSRIDCITREKKRVRLEQSLRAVSCREFFEKNVSFKNEEEAIRYMARKLHDSGVVDESFCDEVLQREQSYSTAYGMVAVPHAMKMRANKTKIYIIINDKPTSWGSGKVNIILLFAINKDDRSIFYEIFDNLIVLLLESKNAHAVIDSKDYESFVNTILRCY